MKIYRVYWEEPYETPDEYGYFLDKAKAEAKREELIDAAIAAYRSYQTDKMPDYTRDQYQYYIEEIDVIE